MNCLNVFGTIIGAYIGFTIIINILYISGHLKKYRENNFILFLFLGIPSLFTGYLGYLTTNYLLNI